MKMLRRIARELRRDRERYKILGSQWYQHIDRTNENKILRVSMIISHRRRIGCLTERWKDSLHF